MASLSKDKNGTKRIMFMDPNGKRRTIRLGKINVKTAEAFLMRIERLIDATRTSTSIDSQTVQWLNDLPSEMHSKLAKVGLVEDRQDSEVHTLGALLEQYFETMSVKDTTRTRYAQSRRLLLERFGSVPRVESITPRDCDQYRAWLVERGYSTAKVSKEISIARMFFKQAVRWEMIQSNPFEGVRGGSQINRERLHYVYPEVAQTLIRTAPDADWRCIIALARFGGLRCPSEVLRVKWVDVNWAGDRMRVRSPKTEHHAGKAERIIPLFPELRTVLMEAYEMAPDGSEYVVERYRDPKANLGTQFKRIIRNAGLEPWPRVFNAMRASRVTELAAEYPSAVCTSWMGHTQAVAEAHYHMVRDEDFVRAAAEFTRSPSVPANAQSGANSGASMSQNTAQQRAASTGNNQQKQSQTDKGVSFMPVPSSHCRSLQMVDNGPGGT
jgi:integrase